MKGELTQSRTDVLIDALLDSPDIKFQTSTDLLTASSNRNEKLRDVALSILARFNGQAPTTHFDGLAPSQAAQPGTSAQQNISGPGVLRDEKVIDHEQFRSAGE